MASWKMCLLNKPFRSGVLIVLIVCLSSVFVEGNLVLRKNVLTVKVGRTVYLNTDDLTIRPMKAGDTGCRVEVVQNDPITQRVGKLEPKIFDCVYQPNTVRYIHSGSPFLNEDRVKLRVHRFSDMKTVTETFYLNVKINNATTDIVVTRGLRHVIVPEFNGLSNTIDASVIRFFHSRSPNVTCTVSFNKWESHWPLVGHIVMGDEHTPVEGLKKTCQEFLYMELRYEHLQKPTPDVDYLPLDIELYDPEASDELMTERFFLPLYIKNALLNSPPRSSFMSMYMVDVDQFVLSTIIPGIISAEDYETPNSLLVYNISKPPTDDQGFFVSLDDHTTPITSFLQDDLENHRIGYQPPTTSFSERKIYEVEFNVYDSHFVQSMPIVLHIAVKPSTSTAPRVSFNTGLVLLEGQSRDINTKTLQIVDMNNIRDIRVYITGGLKHGQFLVRNKLAVYFTIADLEAGRIKYVHDDSESTKDNINLKISDGTTNVMVNFPITIIPKDDNPPYIVNNLGIELNEGQTKRLTTSMLLAHDTDSVDLNIVYMIAQPTMCGEIIRRIRPKESGTRVNKFIQRELTKGQIYYRHFGREEFQDEFIFTLRDQQDPPNESALETFYVAINPINENPPQLSPDATRLMQVFETDIALITKTELEYIDIETKAAKLSYIITTPPFFVSKTGRRIREDAGKIIAMHNLTMREKNADIPEISTFNQNDINHLKIGYMPPINDIGPESRLVRFVYTVQDSSGNKVRGQQFDIDIQPVNDKPPTFTTSKLLVEEGGILGISIDQISANDVDTDGDDLVFILEESPHHGRLQKGGVNLNEKDTFNLLDLRKKDLRYIHDGSEVLMDTLTISVSDGSNRVAKAINIDIVPVDDESPRVRSGLRPHLIVSEGSEVVISPKMLAATDEDTGDESLVFLIVKQPKYGVMQLRGEPATKFTQKDVKDGVVCYIHSSGEIGSHAIKDSVDFIVSDKFFKATADLPTYHLNITITPVDNKKPTIITGDPIVVEEGMIFQFSPAVITAKDPDTEPESIQFFITKQPQWGFIENIKPDQGSEKSNAGIPITTFKLQDVIDHTINYIQATHKGVEPTEDSFDFYATDGRLKSPSQTAFITIAPMNDEEPDVMLNDFQVQEGGSKIIDNSMVDAFDMDMPKETIMMSISQPPEHGDIVVMLTTPNGEIEASVNDFSASDLHKGMKLKYRHDNSEYFNDKFAITVSDGKHEVKKVCTVDIKPINDERPSITKNAGLEIDFGEHAILSSLVLHSVDLDNTDVQVYYIIVALPKIGVLQYCSDHEAQVFSASCRDIRIGQNITQRDINNNYVRYIHTTGMSGSDSDSFAFVLTDGKNKLPVQSFHIKILNSKKAKIALMNKGIDIREGQRVILTTDSLSASDESTNAEDIVFAIIRPPHLGQIEYVDRHLSGISSFTQMDLASQKIVYNHLTKTDFTEDSFTFTVTNGMSDAKDAEFQIRIEPLDKVLPTLAENNLIEVIQGAEVTISAVNIRADDPDTDSSNVTYHVAKQPTYGQMYNRGVYITNLFTQSAIDRGFITYESDGVHTGLDNFLFTVSDGKHEGFLINGSIQLQPAICSVFIKPLVNDAPKLHTMVHPATLEEFDDGRYGFELNSHVLKAVDSDTTNTHLVYVIEQKPKNGHLENSEAKRYVRRRFTQRDLDENALQFIIDMKGKGTNDSFTFRIEDNRGNSLNNQRMELQWSMIEFEKTALVVCENIGTVSLTLTRKGDLGSNAFVSIQTQDKTTLTNEDYISSSAKQVQFDPGMSTATWDLRIVDDGLIENTEQVIIYISQPINAVLGKKRKLRIRLINAEKGECPQYIGMISKHQRNIPDSLYIPDSRNSLESQYENVVLGNHFSKVNRKNPFDNTYNTDPAEFDGSAATSDEAIPGVPSVYESKEDKKKQSSKERKRKKRKNKKGRKRRKGKKRSGGKRNKKKPVDISEKEQVDSTEVQTISNEDMQAPQECTSSTKRLLYFDPNTSQMYECNGDAWQIWRSASNQDQQPETKECQQGWSKFENRCFKFVNERLTWEVSETLCQMSYGAHLATVQSKKHLTWLSELSGKKAYWIGLHMSEEAGGWVYTNSERLGYTNFDGDSPRVKRTLDSRKNCVIVNKSKDWKYKICNKRKSRLICEQDIGYTEEYRSPPKRDISNGTVKSKKRRKTKFKERQSDDGEFNTKKVNTRNSYKNDQNKGFFFGYR